MICIQDSSSPRVVEVALGSDAGRIVSVLILDIESVLTDVMIEVVPEPSRKRIFFRDLDALTLLRKKRIRIAFLTGENDAAAGPVIKAVAGPIKSSLRPRTRKRG